MKVKPVENIGNYKIEYTDFGIGFIPRELQSLEMTAKEMFEKLGYRKVKRQDDYGKYIEYYTGEDDCMRITFYLEDKKIGIGDYTLFDIGIFKAINKQIEELRWDNE